MKKINLMTQYYNSGNKERQDEIIFCLKKNIENRYIDKIILFTENKMNLKEIFKSDKIKEINIRKRLDFCDCFKYSNKHLNNEICIISNSDIYFDETIKIIKDVDFKNIFIALTRHDLTKKGDIIFPLPTIDSQGNQSIITAENSQDAWIYLSPINENIKSDFTLGIPYCERRLVFEISKENIEILNPFNLINAIHVHSSQYRTYKKGDHSSHEGKIKYIKPTDSLPNTINSF